MSSATSATRPNGSTTAHHDDVLSPNGNHLTQEPRPPPAPPVAATPGKKGGKAKKPIDSTETSKLLAQRISQLEHDAAGEKDQEAEIGACLLFFLGAVGGELFVRRGEGERRKKASCATRTRCTSETGTILKNTTLIPCVIDSNYVTHGIQYREMVPCPSKDRC